MPDRQGQPGRQVRPAVSPAAALAAAAAAALLPSLHLPLPRSTRTRRPHSHLPDRRDFVLSSYQELKKANPAFPILVRECSGVEAKLIARYGEPAAGFRAVACTVIYFDTRAVGQVLPLQRSCAAERILEACMACLVAAAAGAGDGCRHVACAAHLFEGCPCGCNCGIACLCSRDESCPATSSLKRRG